MRKSERHLAWIMRMEAEQDRWKNEHQFQRFALLTLVQQAFELERARLMKISADAAVLEENRNRFSQLLDEMKATLSSVNERWWNCRLSEMRIFMPGGPVWGSCSDWTANKHLRQLGVIKAYQREKEFEALEELIFSGDDDDLFSVPSSFSDGSF